MRINGAFDTYIPPRPRETASRVDRSIVAIGFALMLVGSAQIFAMLSHDANVQPTIAIETKDWRGVFAPSEECSKLKTVDANCLASPSSSALWMSERIRGTKSFEEAFERNRSTEYWLGSVISTERLNVAAKASATTLVFAPVHGYAEVYLDGTFQTSHRFLSQALPMHVNVPISRLTDERPLFIAIRVAPYPFYATINTTRAARTEGFFTPLGADHIMRWSMFFGLTRHLMAMVLFLLLARILWKASAARMTAYDYISGAQFALVLGLTSLASVDLTTRLVNVDTHYRLYFLLMTWETIFLGRLTLAFLRASRIWTPTHAAVFAIASAALWIFPSPDWIEATGAAILTKLVLPGTYALCATLLCQRAIKMLRARFAGGPQSRERIEFLFFSAAAMAITGVAYAWESTRNAGLDVHWSRTFNLLTIYLLVRMITKSESRQTLARKESSDLEIKAA